MDSHHLWEGYMGCYDYLTGVESYMTGLREIASAVPQLVETEVLDAGSGTGNLSILLKQNGARVVSCDFAQVALHRHRSKDSTARLVHASLEEPLPFPDGRFDTVYCASVLFALSKTGCELAVREFHRVLCPGGTLVVTVAAPDKRNRRIVRTHLRNMIEAQGWCIGITRFLWRLPHLVRLLNYNRRLQELPDWQGYHRFNEEELVMLLNSAGLGSLRVRRTYGGGFYLVTGKKPAIAYAQNGSHAHAAS